jgi:hypothetical protein
LSEELTIKLEDIVVQYVVDNLEKEWRGGSVGGVSGGGEHRP